MIPRYANHEISETWSDTNKLRLWLRTELAVIRARANLGMLPMEDCLLTESILETHPIDIDWWLAEDQRIRHDLNAFVNWCLQHLPPELQVHFHQDMTSYDTEEPAFATMLSDSVECVQKAAATVKGILRDLAERYRYTIMNARTHGQEAELQTFGKRCLTWLGDLSEALYVVDFAKHNLSYSKLSGAVGNYRGLEPAVEKEALRIMGFKPFYGATQVMPRTLYAPAAGGVCQVVMSLSKIALDIRLGARSGRPLYQEPFAKTQTGSSAMPHKKNTISCEQLEGLQRLALSYNMAIMQNIVTWEERAIEQSCVERVAWPDLFHVAMRACEVMAKVLGGLNVYPDNMLMEIADCCGCYASSETKEFLRRKCVPFGLTSQEAYRIVQLAAFNAFEPTQRQKNLREIRCASLEIADTLLANSAFGQTQRRASLQDTILRGELRVSPQLAAEDEEIARWNNVLHKVFSDPEAVAEWEDIFKPSHLLRNEETLYQEILGE